MSSSKTVLSLEGVTKSYQMGQVRVDALKGIDIHVSEGERVSIIGPSGSGKSTLLHILGLLDMPSTGTVRVDGTDVSKLSDNELSHFRGKKIGFIFQAFHLVPSLSSLENVALPMMFYNVPRAQREKKATEALARLGMDDRLHHLPSELSGGQRQRIAIARSLVNEPTILLADEPTGNLDSKTGEEVLKIFDELNAEGKTLVVVTHDPNIAKRSPRLIKLKDGFVEEDTKNKR